MSLDACIDCGHDDHTPDSVVNLCECDCHNPNWEEEIGYHGQR